jgi:hypothetical protein
MQHSCSSLIRKSRKYLIVKLLPVDWLQWLSGPCVTAASRNLVPNRDAADRGALWKSRPVRAGIEARVRTRRLRGTLIRRIDSQPPNMKCAIRRGSIVLAMEVEPARMTSPYTPHFSPPMKTPTPALPHISSRSTIAQHLSALNRAAFLNSLAQRGESRRL